MYYNKILVTPHTNRESKIIMSSRLKLYQTGYVFNLKEYYEIVGKGRPIRICFTYADSFTEMHF